jgi:ribosome-binding protein aMBF1 (putative translation factor)
MCYAIPPEGGRVTRATGAEKYFDRRMRDPEYAEAYRRARSRIEAVDEVIRTLDERRAELDLSKADLARRAGLKPEVVRRLFSAGPHNPTLSTVSALLGALEVELVVRKRRPTPSRRDPDENRRRSA